MYEKELEYVEEYLKSHNGEDSPREFETFRKRSLHSKRVVKWLDRLIDDEIASKLDSNTIKSIYLSAIFHDVGYGSEHYKNSHPIEGTEIWQNYAKGRYSDIIIDKVSYLIYNHQNKSLLSNSSTPLELILLMEADILDEEGAMSILWDSMVLAHSNPTDYTYALDRIKQYSAHILACNPLRTQKGIKYWQDKQKLVKGFIKALEFDLFIKEE